MYVASHAATELGINSNDRAYRPDNGFSTLAQQDTTGAFYFHPVSLSFTGIFRALCSNDGPPSTLDTTTASRNLSAQPVPLTLGPGIFHNASARSSAATSTWPR